MLEVSYLVEFRNSAEFEAAKNALQALSKGIQITFLDNKGHWMRLQKKGLPA